MEFRSNIIFSIVAHAMIFTAVLALAGRDAVLRVPERFIAIRLLEEAGGRKLEAGNTRQENRTEKALKKTSRFREVVPPEVPPPPAAQEETPAVAPPEKNRPLQQAAGPAEQGPAEKGKTVSPEQIEGKGESGTSLTAVRLAIPGKAATNGSLGGRGDGTSAGNPGAVTAIRAAIERAKSYPPLARKRGIEGTVTAEFTISAKGYPENIRIVRSSGHEILDSAAKKTLLRASPFPGVKGRLEVPITFRLDR
jgi:protein TonB